MNLLDRGGQSVDRGRPVDNWHLEVAREADVNID